MKLNLRSSFCCDFKANSVRTPHRKVHSRHHKDFPNLAARHAVDTIGANQSYATSPRVGRTLSIARPRDDFDRKHLQLIYFRNLPLNKTRNGAECVTFCRLSQTNLMSI